MSKGMKVSQVLRAALDSFFNGKRWIKGDYSIDKGNSYEDPLNHDKERVYAEGAYCAVGAIQAIDCSQEAEDQAILTLAQAIDGKKEPDSPEHTVTNYNDKPERKWWQIKQKFEKAITLAQKKESKGDVE